jgi:hypothetical protein
VIADQLAGLNFEVYEALKQSRGPDKETVGPRSIVIWRRRRDARPDRPGGGHLFYTGTSRDQAGTPGIPTIINGNDVIALASVFMEMVHPLLSAADFDPSTFNLDTDEMNKRLAALPDTPDDKLR